MHGQTVLHRPRERFTRQLCDGGRAAARLGLDVVADFRSADVAAGGQGAPLAPLYHAAISARVCERPLMFLNWGGVGNVTYLGAGRGDRRVRHRPRERADRRFRRAPSRPHSRRRRRAAPRAAGSTSEMVARFMRDPYFALPAPKSLDRNHFHALAEAVDTLGDADGAATLAAFTVEATAAALRHVGPAPARWLVCGGGRRNLALMRSLAARLGASVEPIEVDRLGRRRHRSAVFRLSRACARGAACRSRCRRRPARRAPLTGGVFWPAPK